jgi:hypothetical protein
MGQVHKNKEPPSQLNLPEANSLYSLVQLSYTKIMSNQVWSSSQEYRTTITTQPAKSQCTNTIPQQWQEIQPNPQCMKTSSKTSWTKTYIVVVYITVQWTQPHDSVVLYRDASGGTFLSYQCNHVAPPASILVHNNSFSSSYIITKTNSYDWREKQSYICNKMHSLLYCNNAGFLRAVTNEKCKQHLEIWWQLQALLF